MRREHNNIYNIVGVFFMLTVFLECSATSCPNPETILPCRCSMRSKEIQIWCSHSNLPQVMEGIKALENNVQGRIDELVLENNHLPALSGRFFGSLEIVRLMLRYNSIERVSNGWLNELENSLVEIYIVEPQLRSIPVESLYGMLNILAITIQSDELRHVPDFSGLLSLNYLSVQSNSLTELQPLTLRHLPKIQNIHITGGVSLNRLEAGLFEHLTSLKHLDLSRNGINWIHLRALSHLPNLLSLKLSYNHITNAGMVGRIVKDLEHLKKLRLDHNLISVIEEGSFMNLPHLMELHLNDNRITEIQYGAFVRMPMLKTIYLHNNLIKRIHPECFLQASGSSVETVYIHNNEIEQVKTMQALLKALPRLKFLDMSNNYMTELTYGALHGHDILEQLHLNNNQLRLIERDALITMPELRELRLRNNSLHDGLAMPFWNLPGLKGLDLAQNNFRRLNATLLAGLPMLKRLDLSENGIISMDKTMFRHNPLLETLNVSTNALNQLHAGIFRQLNHLFEVDASLNQLTEIIPGLPCIVERLSLRGNKITTLPQVVSKTLSLPNLRMLELGWNRIEQLSAYGFQGLPQLRVLSLANNRLRRIESSTFTGATRLELLLLQDNAITFVDDTAFRALPELHNLNLQGNQLDIITDNLLSNNSKLEQLDLSRNLIRSIGSHAFEMQNALEFLDLSDNVLNDMFLSLASLSNLHDIDLSYNQITRIQAEVVSAWRQAIEIRLSNNLISELKQGSFRNLPKLQYLELSSNVINNVEPGALQHLPELQELVLADNKLEELKDHVFEYLPNLLASHFQYNKLRYISPNGFFNCPSMVFLNLSNNNFRTMENVGLRNMRNLEVLDLSFNNIKTITTMPLKALNWLVELKMDNNEICKLQGTPFENMPRLRMLSMRHNHLRIIKERMFHKLRTNIAVLDVEGNPINCSCEMQWLSVWLQETDFPFAGPRCADGRLLRQYHIDRSLCTNLADNNGQRARGSNLTDFADNNELPINFPLYNDHGDIFQRELLDELNEECDVNDEKRPLPNESKYYYEQYLDYRPASNETGIQPAASSTPAAIEEIPLRSSSAPHANIDMNNTLLNTNYINGKRPSANGNQAQSAFTFFGYPIPSLNLGPFFAQSSHARKDRSGYEARYSQHGRYESRSANDISATMPVTHRMNTGSARSKTRMYNINSATEFEKYLSNKTYENSHELSAASEETAINSQDTSGFRTTFRVPAKIESNGFRPMLPQHIGGFVPVLNPKQLQFEPINATANNNNNSTVATYYVTEATVDVSTATTTYATQDNSVTELYDEDSLETQSVNLIRPPALLPSTTAETILLIPPPEEQAEQYKKQSWIGSSTTLSNEIDDTAMQMLNVQTQRSRAGGRSTIVKVYTPETLNQYLPTAEEYFRTTTLPTHTNQQHLIANGETPAVFQQRKNGMDWYYDSFMQPRLNASATRRTANLRNAGHSFQHSSTAWILFLIVIKCLLSK